MPPELHHSVASLIDMLLQHRQPDGDPPWAEMVIQSAKRGWDDTRNPIFVSVAYREARAAQLPIPEWVLEHLDQAMAEIQRILNDPPPAKKINAAVASAFGFRVGGGPSLFARAKASRWIWLASLVRGQVEIGHSEHNAQLYVARQNDVDYSTVKRAWVRYKRVHNLSF